MRSMVVDHATVCLWWLTMRFMVVDHALAC
jgi:hypothetical protein